MYEHYISNQWVIRFRTICLFFCSVGKCQINNLFYCLHQSIMKICSLCQPSPVKMWREFCFGRANLNKVNYCHILLHVGRARHCQCYSSRIGLNVGSYTAKKKEKKRGSLFSEILTINVWCRDINQSAQTVAKRRKIDEI